MDRIGSQQSSVVEPAAVPAGDRASAAGAHSMIFDNTKVKRLVPDYAAAIPFAQGAKEIVAWFDSDPANREVDEQLNQTIDRILAAYASAWPAK